MNTSSTLFHCLNIIVMHALDLPPNNFDQNIFFNKKKKKTEKSSKTYESHYTNTSRPDVQIIKVSQAVNSKFVHWAHMNYAPCGRAVRHQLWLFWLLCLLHCEVLLAMTEVKVLEDLTTNCAHLRGRYVIGLQEVVQCLGYTDMVYGVDSSGHKRASRHAVKVLRFPGRWLVEIIDNMVSLNFSQGFVAHHPVTCSILCAISCVV